MANQDDIIYLIEGKIAQAIHVAEGFKADNEQLKQQVAELSQMFHLKDQELKVLESKYHSLKLAKTLSSSSEDAKNVKNQVNRMVREIDKCIALLNR